MLSDPARIPVSGAMGAARDVPYVTAQISVATANAQAVRFMMFSLVQGGGKRRSDFIDRVGGTRLETRLTR
jgi:hypothetical protein